MTWDKPPTAIVLEMQLQIFSGQGLRAIFVTTGYRFLFAILRMYKEVSGDGLDDGLTYVETSSQTEASKSAMEGIPLSQPIDVNSEDK